MKTLGDLYTILSRLLLVDARCFGPEDEVTQIIKEGINQTEEAIAQTMNVERIALARIPKNTEIPKAVIPGVKIFFLRLKGQSELFDYLPT